MGFIAVAFICLDTEYQHEFTYRAYSQGMTADEYTFIFYTMLPSNKTYHPWLTSDDNLSDTEIENRKKAYLAVKQVYESITVCVLSW